MLPIIRSEWSLRSECKSNHVTVVPVKVTSGVFVAHGYSYAHLHCRTSKYCRTFMLHSVCLWNDLGDCVFDSVGLVDFKNRVTASLMA